MSTNPNITKRSVPLQTRLGKQNDESLELTAWEQLWSMGETPWDYGASSPVLLDLLTSNSHLLPAHNKITALVPGCGSGYDALVLSKYYDLTIGLDFSQTAINRACKLQKDTGISEDKVKYIQGDFFTYNPERPIDLIYEYTFLSTFPQNEREKWAKQMYKLLDQNGVLVTLLFPVGEIEGGPPYATNIPHIKKLLESLGFEVSYLQPATNSIKQRADREWLGIWKKKPIISTL